MAVQGICETKMLNLAALSSFARSISIVTMSESAKPISTYTEKQNC